MTQTSTPATGPIVRVVTYKNPHARQATISKVTIHRAVSNDADEFMGNPRHATTLCGRTLRLRAPSGAEATYAPSATTAVTCKTCAKKEA